MLFRLKRFRGQACFLHLVHSTLFSDSPVKIRRPRTLSQRLIFTVAPLGTGVRGWETRSLHRRPDWKGGEKEGWERAC